MKKIFCFFIGLLLLFSCQQNAVNKPDNLIDEETMEEIIYDLTILEAIRTSNSASLERKKITASTYVYDKYDIDSLQFASSNHYYASDVHNYLKMYKRIEERLVNDKTKIDTVIAREVKAASLKKDKLKISKDKETNLKSDSLKRKRIDKKLESNN